MPTTLPAVSVSGPPESPATMGASTSMRLFSVSAFPPLESVAVMV
jgi:hypothetical protein